MEETLAGRVLRAVDAAGIGINEAKERERRVARLSKSSFGRSWGFKS
jgi:hypothetical protein